MEIRGCLGGSAGGASAFGSGHDLGFLGSSPTLGSLLGGESASPSPSTLLLLPVSLSQKKKKKKNGGP